MLLTMSPSTETRPAESVEEGYEILKFGLGMAESFCTVLSAAKGGRP